MGEGSWGSVPPRRANGSPAQTGREITVFTDVATGEFHGEGPGGGHCGWEVGNNLRFFFLSQPPSKCGIVRKRGLISRISLKMEDDELRATPVSDTGGVWLCGRTPA